MALKYYKIFSSSSLSSDFSTNPIPSRVYTLRVSNNITYGFDNFPYEYVLYTRSTTGSGYKWYEAEQNVTADNSTEVLIGYYGTVSFTHPAIYFAVDENSQIDNILKKVTSPVSLSNITGKYRLNKNLLQAYTTSVPSSSKNYHASFIVDFTIDGTIYRGFSLYNPSNVSTFSSSYLRLYKDNNVIEEYTLVNFGNKYNGSVFEFSNTDLPTDIVTWLKSAFEEIYPYTYTIKDYTGEITLGEITEAPPMSNAVLTVIGNQKTLTLTGVNDVDYSIQWMSDTPEGKQFLGLSTSPESNRPTLPTNTTSSVSWVGDLVFYESYGTYRPPATTFDINLYQNSAEVNRVDKGQFLVGVGTLSGALREECSMLTPSIVYQSSDVPTFNYVYIPIFNRYYYVTSLSSVSKNVWRMELNCDVLMTYKQQIFLLQGVIGRQEIDFNPMLVDSELPTQDNPEVEIINIPSTAFLSHTNITGNLYNFVLTVIG